MERFKVIFTDRNSRHMFAAIVLILFVLILAQQFIVTQMTDSFKKAMFEHDYEVAGYLKQNGVDPDLVISAFTSAKAVSDAKYGYKMLSSSGYSEKAKSSLFPEVKSFYRKFSTIVLLISIMFSLLLLCCLYRRLVQTDAQLMTADLNLRQFLDGDTTIRLNDSGEGSLSRLFSAVNAMATSLTAHIEIEKQNKQFLKDTISDISHQLKTPLAALKMYNEIVTDEKIGNQVVESFTQKSRRELERMENLIQNLLKLARFDAGAIELEKGVHNLQGFLENTAEVFLTRAEMEGKKVSVNGDTGAEFSFDEMWLGEAVGNIIKNALDHTAAGNSIDISYTATAMATVITVRDNGNGIHPEDIHHIFKRFYRSRFSKSTGGVGIGLPLAKAIVEKHGGTVTVQSELGKGAEFHIIFPKLSNL